MYIAIDNGDVARANLYLTPRKNLEHFTRIASQIGATLEGKNLPVSVAWSNAYPTDNQEVAVGSPPNPAIFFRRD